MKRLLFGVFACASLFIHDNVGFSQEYVSKFNSATPADKKLSLIFPLNSLFINKTIGAVLCADSTTEVKEVFLGKEESTTEQNVQFNKASGGCYQLSNINFIESGNWILKTVFSDLDLGEFVFPVVDTPPVPEKLFLTAESTQKKFLAITFSTKTATSQTDSAVLCSNSTSKLTEAKLWMTDMGHGAGPTKLVQLENFCTKIDNIEFFMHGNWEIRFKFQDGDKGAIHVSVN